MKIFLRWLFHIWLYALYYAAKVPLALILLIKLNVRYRNLGELFSTRGPYLLLPNHTNQWDPFILALISPLPIRWVATDAALRGPLRHVIRAIGTIPKVKGKPDIITINEIKEAVKRKQAAGIFPEGAQNWDGISLEIIPSTAKLIRFLKLPVIIPILKGGYLSKPRWAWKIRRCRVEVCYKRIIDADEIHTIKLSEIEHRLREALKYDEYEWQKTAQCPIQSRRRAEHLELAHWACPACQTMGTMHSEGNVLFCECGYRVYINRFGFFIFPEGGPSFGHPSEWISWQHSLLENRIGAALDIFRLGKDDPVLFEDNPVTLMRGGRAEPMRKAVEGRARLFVNRIEIENLQFPLNKISAVSTFKQQKFEYHFNKDQYQFQFLNRSISGWKWETACKMLQENQSSRTD